MNIEERKARLLPSNRYITRELSSNENMYGMLLRILAFITALQAGAKIG